MKIAILWEKMNGKLKRAPDESLRWMTRSLLVTYGVLLVFFPLDQYFVIGGLLWNPTTLMIFNHISAIVVFITLLFSWKRPHRAPRIYAVIYIVILLLVALDAVYGDQGFSGRALSVFIYNIPTLILLAALVVSWRYEIVGAVVFNLAGLSYVGWLLTVTHHWHRFSGWFMVIGAPMIVIGVLFFLNWKARKNRQANGEVTL